MKTILIAVSCIAAYLTTTAAPDAKQPLPQKPNVLFIAIDDLNDWVGCLGGHPQTLTPNIDRLAARGTLFTNAHCAAPACNPSRAALMTGIRPSTSGVYLNPQPWRKSLPDAVTLPQHFLQHGYTAIGSGKIFHGAFPDPASWDEFWPSKSKQSPGNPTPKKRPLNGIPNTAHFDWGPVDATDEEMGDSQVADWVIGKLNAKHDKPFFLACGFFRPHLPFYAPQKYFDRFPLEDVQKPPYRANDLDDIPPAGKSMAKQGDHRNVVKHHQWEAAVQGYLASISFVDGQVGRVLDALDTSGHAEDTIIVLWTDHGWHLGQKNDWRKFALWEETTQTPLIFVVPGLTKPGQRCARPVNLLDIYPTLAELCGLSHRETLEGASLRPLLADAVAPWAHRSITTHGRNNHAVRSERYRYIHYADGSEELYDHQNDPNEWTNLARDPAFADIIAEHAKWLPQINAPSAPVKRTRKSKNKADRGE